jgi:hypothetical protein
MGFSMDGSMYSMRNLFEDEVRRWWISEKEKLHGVAVWSSDGGSSNFLFVS